MVNGYIDEGVHEETLYEAQNVWYTLLGGTGSPAVEHIAVSHSSFRCMEATREWI